MVAGESPNAANQRTSFLPPNVDCSSWAALEPLYRALLDRPLTSRAELRQWLRDVAELDDTVDEAATWAYIRHTCHTDDPALEKAYMHVVEQIEPNVKPLFFELQKKFLSALQATGLDDDPIPGQLARRWQADVDVYCEQNIPRQVQETKLSIFMNAAGLQGDVRTLLHEGGDAFHAMEAWTHVDLTFVRGAPMEFSEVASMAMELLAAGAYDEFYPAEEAARARRTTLEGAVRILAWIATIDGFQHWIYANPGHTPDERTACWLSLLDRFGSRWVSWTGLEDARATSWQVQLHLFNWPFYYIEYGIAQLGALHLWLQYRRDPARTLENYRRALALGGTRPLPELFAAAGIPFDFSATAITPLVEAVREELAAVPA